MRLILPARSPRSPRTTRRTRRFALPALVAAAALVLASCAGDDLASDDDAPASGAGGAVTIVNQDFPSANVLSWIYAAVLEDAGYEPEVLFVGTRDVYIQEGNFDVAPEYVGGIANYLNLQENGADAPAFTQTDPAEMAEAAQPLLESRGLTLLDPSEANDANAYFVTQEFAEANDLETLSDLGELGEPVVLAAARDCEGRADCEAGLRDEYGIDITRVSPTGFATVQTYEAVLNGEAQLGQTSTIDPSLESQGLVLLEDDRQIQPAQNLVPLVDSAFLEANPDVADVLNALMAELTSEDVTELTTRVTVDRERAEDVAREWVESSGLTD